MISSLSGVLSTRNPTRVVLDVGGIGFELIVPISTARVLPETGTAVTLQVQSVFTREGMSLFGFSTQDEKDAFNRLTEIKGIGPKAALNLLSRFSPAEISGILAEEKIETLKTVPGIGPKKAEMILGRIRKTGASPATQEPALEQAIAALNSLGLTRAEALKRLERIANRSQLALTDLLSQALKHTD
jgi:holliday junction DNA helicase RuvA